jgi:multidrug resistance efflux pump
MQAGASGVVQKEVIANAERDTVYTERVMQRKRNLYERGFLPLQDAEAAERDWQQSKARVLVAQTQLRALEQALKLLEAGARPEEIEQVQAEVQAAGENLRAAEKSRGQLMQKKQEVAATGAVVNVR